MSKIIANKLIAFILSVSMLVSLVPSFSITLTAETTTDSTESTETTDQIQKDFVAEYGAIVSKDYYPSTDIPSAIISSTDPVIVYDDVINGASYGVKAENVTGLQIWLEQSIVYSNGNIIYRYSLVDQSHDFQQTALRYQFIPAEYVTPITDTGSTEGGEGGDGSTTNPTCTCYTTTSVHAFDCPLYVYNPPVPSIKTDDSTGISVSANLPADVTLTVIPKSLAETGINTSIYPVTENSLFFDVTLIQNGSEYLPSDGVSVTFPADKIPFNSGSSYCIYHISNDGSVQSFGPYTYNGGDISYNFGSLSIVGIAENVEDTGIYLDFVVAGEDPDPVNMGAQIATITSTNLNIYANQTYGSLGVNVGDASGEEIELLLSFTYSNGEVIYQFAYRGTTNAALAEAAVDYYFISADDVVLNGTTDEQPEEVINAYESLIKSATLDDFEEAYYACNDNGYTDSFTTEQWAEIGRVGNLLETMALSIEDLEEYNLEGAPSVEGAKLYLNPVTWPDEYVTLSMEAMATSFDVISVVAENATVECEYVTENGDEYYIIDTSSWTDFVDKIPYKYIKKSDFTFDNKWIKENKNGVFTIDDVKVYDHSLSTYFQLNNGTSLGSFEILYSFVTVESGIETKWYVIKTNNWTDAYGNTVTGKFVKAENVSSTTILTDVSGVSVEGDIPEGATLSVSTVSVADTDIADGIYVVGENSLFYDVTLLDENGNETQPGQGGITVIFPESAVVATGLNVGDKYHVYHVHDGNVDMSEVKTYNGGNIEMFFSNLSAVGISEVETKINLESLYGTASDADGFTSQVVYLDSFVTLYEHFQGEVAYAELTGYQNTKIEIYNEIVFTDSEGNVSDFKLYQFAYYGEEGTDLYDILNAYQFISSEDISFIEIETDTATKELYNKLMATETIEEWLEVEHALTEEEWNTFELMDDAMQDEIDAHYRSLPTAVHKAYNEVTTALLSSATVAEYDAWLQTITPEVHEMILGNYEMNSALITHIDALLAAEDTSPKNVTNYTNAAPFVSLATGIEPITPFSLLRNASVPTSYAAVRAAETVRQDVEGVVTSKNVVKKSDGVYTVTLETYVTGEKVTQTIEKYVPTDIIVVVDQSGSMENDMSGYIYTTYAEKFSNNLTASQIYGNYSNYQTRNNTYVKIGNDYVEVTVERSVASTEEIETYKTISNSKRNNSYYTDYGNSGNLYYDVNGEKVKVFVTRIETGTGTYGCNTEYTMYQYIYTDANGEIVHTSDEDAADDTPGVQFYYLDTETVETYNYTFTYTDADGNTVTHTYNADDVVPTGSETSSVPTGTYYFREATTEHRLDALIRALTNFADSVEDKTAGKDGVKGTEDDVNHRIAIVGFSSDSFNNTEILTGCTISETTKKNDNNTNYYPDGYAHNGVQYNSTGYNAATRTALVDMNTTAGQTSVANAIDALTAHGGTQTDHGMDMALDIWAAEADKGTVYTETVDGVTTTVRNKVVILFTDGKPTGEGSNFNNTVANNAISYSRTIKNTYNATVYTIGIFDNANGTINVTNEGQNASLPSNLSDENEFAHYVSSNFKTAVSMTDDGDGETFHKDPQTKLYTGKSYYLSADNSDALNNIFQTISEDVQNESEVYELDETTVIKDIVAPNFQIPANASSVNVYTADTNGMTGTTPSFADREEATGVTVTLDGTNVNVSGFDFAENWVGKVVVNNNTTYHGKKLIIEFDIPVDPDFLGGNAVKTNGDESGVYVPVLDEDGASTGEYTLVENFTRPTVDVPLKPITNVANDKHIYYSNSTDLTEILDLYVQITNTSGSSNLQVVVDGVNNAYVDLVYTITLNDGTVGTYTIPAGKAWAEGTWVNGSVTDANRNPVLSSDATYTVSCVMTTSTADASGNTQSVNTSKTANIYVYKPVLTFKDTEVYWRETVVDYSNNGYDTVTWINGQTLSSSVQMEGNIPEIALSYTPALTDANYYGTVDGKLVATTKNDIPVSVTVNITGSGGTKTESRGGNVTFVHDSCGHTDCDFDSTTEEFIVHILFRYTSLTITKAGWIGQTIDPNQTFIFIVSGKDADGSDMNLEVTVHGNGSTTIDGLTVGNVYTVTEKTDWSWRYSFDNAAIKTFNNGLINGIDSQSFISDKATATATLKLGVENNEIIVTNTRPNIFWLDGDSWCDNRFSFSN